MGFFVKNGVLALAVIVLVVGVQAMGSGSKDIPLAEHDLTFCKNIDPVMDPFYEVRYDQDVVWQIPADPKAILFMAHGKDKEPLSYFDSGPNCKQCYGFPEDRAIVLEALHRRYAVILVKSEGSYWQPWSVSWPPESSKDRLVVTSIIKEWTREHSLEHLPLAAFGFSSGGNFSTLLTLDLDVRSLVLMCTSGEFQVLEHATVLFPPTLFVSMTEDNGPLGYYTLGLEAIQVLRTKGVVVAEVDVFPRPVTRFFFAERITCLGLDISEKIYAAYKAEGWLDEGDYLIINPAYADWKGVLWKWNVLPICRTWDDEDDLCFAQHVEQELKMAYAYHCLTSIAKDAVYNWLDFTLFASQDVTWKTVASL